MQRDIGAENLSNSGQTDSGRDTLLVMGSARILGAFRGPVRDRARRAGPAGGAAVSGAASVVRAIEGAAIRGEDRAQHHRLSSLIVRLLSPARSLGCGTAIPVMATSLVRLRQRPAARHYVAVTASSPADGGRSLARMCDVAITPQPMPSLARGRQTLECG
jgi:hypothetical protein